MQHAPKRAKWIGNLGNVYSRSGREVEGWRYRAGWVKFKRLSIWSAPNEVHYNPISSYSQGPLKVEWISYVCKCLSSNLDSIAIPPRVRKITFPLNNTQLTGGWLEMCFGLGSVQNVFHSDQISGVFEQYFPSLLLWFSNSDRILVVMLHTV